MLDENLIPLNLTPLVRSNEFDDIESELKEVFLHAFATRLRDKEREINVYGAPQLGSLSLVERNVTRDGLALLHSVDPSMRYLYKAWKSRNPKRGLHFLKTYLQLIWPNGWVVDQLWQDKSRPYPTGLVARGRNNDEGNSVSNYLTSRIRISIESDADEHLNIATILPALRAVTPAKFVLDITVLKRFSSFLCFANGGTFLSTANFAASIAPETNFADAMGAANGAELGQFVFFDCAVGK